MSPHQTTTNDKFEKLSVSPARAAADLESLAAVVDFLTEVAPPTLTARQLLFFLAAAVHDLRGTPVTLTRIREIYEGLGRSIAKSKDMLLEPTKQYQDAVGWLTQEHDPDDRRVRYLRLTDKGYAVLNGMIESARA